MINSFPKLIRNKTYNFVEILNFVLKLTIGMFKYNRIGKCKIHYIVILGVIWINTLKITMGIKAPEYSMLIFCNTVRLL